MFPFGYRSQAGSEMLWFPNGNAFVFPFGIMVHGGNPTLIGKSF
jgi:hypothetical protein